MLAGTYDYTFVINQISSRIHHDDALFFAGLSLWLCVHPLLLVVVLVALLPPSLPLPARRVDAVRSVDMPAHPVPRLGAPLAQLAPEAARVDVVGLHVAPQVRLDGLLAALEAAREAALDQVLDQGQDRLVQKRKI